MKSSINKAVTDIKMTQEKTDTRKVKLVGLVLMLVTSILIILFSIEIIFRLVMLIYPAYMSFKVRILWFKS